MLMPKDDAVELRWVLAVIRRRLWFVIGCTLLTVTIAFAASSRLPPVYSATTTLLVEPPDDAQTSQYNTLVAGERLALTYSEMLKGQTVLQQVISRLGLAESPDALAKRIKAEPVRDTQLVSLSVTGSSPAEAALLANTVADEFAAHTKTLQENRYSSYLSDMRAKIEAQLSLVEETQARADKARAKKVGNEAELTRLATLLADHRSEYQTLQQEYQDLQSAMAQWKDAVKIVEPARMPETELWPPSQTASLMLKVDQAEINRMSDLSEITTSQRLASVYPQMLLDRSVLEAAIAALNMWESPDALAKRVKSDWVPNTQSIRLSVVDNDSSQAIRLADTIALVFVNRVRGMLAKPDADQLATIQAQMGKLTALIEEIQANSQTVTQEKLSTDVELPRLESLLTEYRSDYRALQQDYERLRLTAARAADTVVITERAQLPETPVSSRWLYVLLAASVGALVALGITFLIEYLHDSLETPEEISRALGLGTLGTIGQFARGTDGLVTTAFPQSPSAEAFRVLAANIRLSITNGSLHTLLVTSPVAADGKSTVAANLAVALASAGLRVVAVDADLRFPRMHQLFGLEQDPGLTDSLSQGSIDGKLHPSYEDLRHLTQVEGLTVLTSGVLPPDPARMVSSPNMAELLAELERQADVVVIDSPPVLAVADTTILASEADGVLLVVRAHHTWRQDAQRAVEALQRVGTRMVGAVLNAVPCSRDGYYGYYREAGGKAGTPAGKPAAKRRYYAAVIAASIALVGAMAFLFREPILLAIGDYLVIQDNLQPADVISVISGPDDRTDYGIQLYEQGYGKEIFFTGGWCPQIQGIHAERGRERAIAQGVPPQAIATDGYQVTSTYEEAERLKIYIAQSQAPIRSVIIVSDPHHMRRARWAYHQVLGNGVKLQMAPVPFQQSPYQRRWWADAASGEMVKEEYLKIAYYYARYHLSWGPLQRWLASLDQEG
jgi:capsular exopolysaccharide synthesis family protein